MFSSVPSVLFIIYFPRRKIHCIFAIIPLFREHRKFRGSPASSVSFHEEIRLGIRVTRLKLNLIELQRIGGLVDSPGNIDADN